MIHSVQLARAARCLRAGLCGTALALAAVGGQTATLGGTLTASVTLTASCVVVGATSAGNGSVNLGTLSFGSQPGTFTGTIPAILTGGAGGSGTTQVLCSPDVNGLQISIDGGTNAGQGSGIGVGTRAMRNGTAFVPYEVYRDAGHNIAYPVGTALTGFAVPANGTAIDLPIFGQINKTSATALPAGTYTDTLVVTLTF